MHTTVIDEIFLEAILDLKSIDVQAIIFGILQT